MSVGFTYELCAGLADKAGKSLAQTATEEIWEECGYKVAAGDLTEVSTSVASAGTAGAVHTIFFAEVDDGQDGGQGGGEPDSGEAIEVLALPFDKVDPFIRDSKLSKSPGLLFGLVWAAGELRARRIGRSREHPLLTGTLELQSVLPS